MVSFYAKEIAYSWKKEIKDKKEASWVIKEDDEQLGEKDSDQKCKITLQVWNNMLYLSLVIP